MALYTIKNVTERQIASLRNDAGQAGDFVQVYLCDVALQNSAPLDDYTVLETHDRRILKEQFSKQLIAHGTPTKKDFTHALRECVKALNDAAFR